MLPFLRRKARVLLLDDDSAMQRLISTLLKRAGYRVAVFLTGREAIAALSKSDYGVLLLDLMMPHEGGLTVIQHLRTRSPETLKRTLLLTGSPSSLIDKIDADVAGVVQKPFTAAELLGAVNRIAALK